MKKKPLLIVLIISCCVFTERVHAQSLWELFESTKIEEFIDAGKHIDSLSRLSIFWEYKSDSLIGSLHIGIRYDDSYRNAIAEVKKCVNELRPLTIEIDNRSEKNFLSLDQKTIIDEYVLVLNSYSDLKVSISINTYQYRGKPNSHGEPIDSELLKQASHLIGEIEDYMMLKGVGKNRVIVESIPL